MNSTTRLVSASLFALSTLLAQGGPPPDGPGGHGGPGGPGGPGFGGPPVTGAPYSATKTDTRQETLADGNQIQETHTEKVYRDTDGRMRSESTMTTPSGTTRTMITIFDPVAGFMAHLNPTDSTAMKQTLPPAPSGTPKAHKAPPTDVNAPQMVKADLGVSTIAGLAATGTKMTRTIPAGAIGNTNPIVETREVWVSTALKIPVQMTSADPEHGTSTMILSNVTQAAPDATLFQIPSGYTVKEGPAGHGPGGPHGGPGGPPPPDAL